MKAQRSWRNRCAYMLAGEGAMLVLWLLWFTLFHTVVDRAENLEVGRTERKLGRLDRGGASFDFVDPVKELSHGCVIAAGGFRRELHRGIGNLPPIKKEIDLGEIVLSGSIP